MNDPVVAVLLILGVMVVGEAVSILTRARIPMLLVAMLGYMVLIWTGVFPKDLLNIATLGTFGAVMVAPLIIHMGTLIPFKVIKSQWKTVMIALCGMIGAVILIMLIITPLFGYATAVSASGPLAGGTIAFLITTEKLTEIGMTSLIAVPALIIAIQGLIGMPITTFFLRRFAQKVKQSIHADGYAEAAASAESFVNPSAAKQTFIPKKFQTPTVLLFQLFLGGLLAFFLGKVTGVSFSVWALIIGIAGTYFKFYQPKMLEKSNSFGISMVALIFYIMVPLTDVTPSMFAKSLVTVLVIMVVGIAGIMVAGFIASKLFKWDHNKGIAVALTALLGFPADYILCEEVSRSVGDNEREEKAIFNEIVTPMLVGGFTTVTTGSIVIASILMNTL